MIEENTHNQGQHGADTERGTRVTGLAGAEKRVLDRFAAIIRVRAVCANERSYGSARGETSDNRPYATSPTRILPESRPVLQIRSPGRNRLLVQRLALIDQNVQE